MRKLEKWYKLISKAEIENKHGYQAGQDELEAGIDTYALLYIK